MLDGYRDVLTVDDIQKILGISKNEAYQLVNSGEFHAVRVGRLFRIPKNGFEKWMYGRNQITQIVEDRSPEVPKGAMVVTDKEDILFLEKMTKLPTKKKQKIYRVIYDLLDFQD